MREPIIQVPATCPLCAREALHSLSTAATAAALLNGERLGLKCPCATEWTANPIEREQIREYLAVLEKR